ncbi:aminotransferase class I/II-fold pyridoxal phosphate-dependent enzyme [Candidatus Woesearchaeota archaeon]|nr:aminotransferase class I/II-fold pyridoxal phosphate-dependent enzyme [Candidatus Woesearchaeota archaeon]
MVISHQAKILNDLIKNANQGVYDLLSVKGKGIYFPSGGILAQAGEAKEKNINATIGQAIDDDGSPMRVKAIDKNIMLPPEDAFFYTSSFGKPELRRKWKELILKKNPSLSSKISIPVATNALTHALSIAGYMFVDPKDRIILADKFWGNYKLIFTNGFSGILDTFNTFKDNGFDTEAFSEVLLSGPGKKIVLLNFPNNPSGYTPTEKEAQKIIDILKNAADNGEKIVVLLDDAYFGLVYEEGIYTESLFSKIADLHKNILAVKIDGPTKEDYVWGFRIGFITFGIKKGNNELYSALENKTAGAIRGNISNACHLSQSLLLEAYNNPKYDRQKKQNYVVLKSRYEKVKEVLKNQKYTEYFRSLPYNSGYFMCVKINENIDAEKLRRVLLEKYSTGIIVMGNIARIAYSAVSKEKIQDLFSNLFKACKEVMEG